MSARHSSLDGISYRTMRRLRAQMISIAVANGATCPECGLPLKHGQRLHLDHVVPLSAGGSNRPDNWRILHSACNLRKGSRHPEQRPQPFIRKGSRAW